MGAPAPKTKSQRAHLHVVKSLPTVEATNRITFAQIAIELDISRARCWVLLAHWGTALGADRCRTSAKGGYSGITYDACVVDYLAQMLGQAHRCNDPVESDWLSNYERKTE